MTEERPKRRWRWLRRLGLIILGLLVTTFAGLWWESRTFAIKGQKELAEVVAAIETTDPRWRYEHLEEDRVPIDELHNSMRITRDAAKAVGPWHPEELTLPEGEDPLDRHLPLNRRLDAESLGLVRAFLKKREHAVSLAISVKKYPRGRGEFELKDNVLNTLIPHVEDVRMVGMLLELDAERLLHDGPRDEVPDRILAMLHAETGLRDDPFLISLLVRVAVQMKAVRLTERWLGLGAGLDASCQQLLTRFLEASEEKALRAVLRSERALYHRLFENLETGRVSAADFLAQGSGNASSQPDWVLRAAMVRYQARLYEDHAYLLARFNEACDIAQLPSWEQIGVWDTWQDEVKSVRAEFGSKQRLILSGILLPTVNKVGEAAVRGQAEMTACVGALAVERFRLANKRWPKALEEVCPRFLAKVPLDPYTGESLRYALREDGVVVYSVGPDGVDGGGEVLQPPKGNALAPHDLGMRLWNPKQRGLPPKVDKGDANPDQ